MRLIIVSTPIFLLFARYLNYQFHYFPLTLDSQNTIGQGEIIGAYYHIVFISHQKYLSGDFIQWQWYCQITVLGSMQCSTSLKNLLLWVGTIFTSVTPRPTYLVIIICRSLYHKYSEHRITSLKEIMGINYWRGNYFVGTDNNHNFLGPITIHSRRKVEFFEAI